MGNWRLDFDSQEAFSSWRRNSTLLERLDPIEKVAFAMLMDAMRCACYEVAEKDEPFSDLLWLMLPETEVYFDIVKKKLGAFPSQVDFVRDCLMKSGGWDNLSKFMKGRSEIQRKYRELVHGLLSELGISARK